MSEYCIILLFHLINVLYNQVWTMQTMVEFVASWACVQVLPDAPSRPGAPSGTGTDPKAIFGPCYGASRPLLYARPISLFLSLFLSLLLPYCRHVPLTVRLILVRLTYCTHPSFTLSRDAPYNSKRDSYYYIIIASLLRM